MLYTACCQVVMSVLMKLAGGSASLADQLDVDAFLEQVCKASGRNNKICYTGMKWTIGSTYEPKQCSLVHLQ